MDVFQLDPEQRKRSCYEECYKIKHGKYPSRLYMFFHHFWNWLTIGLSLPMLIEIIYLVLVLSWITLVVAFVKGNGCNCEKHYEQGIGKYQNAELLRPHRLIRFFVGL